MYLSKKVEKIIKKNQGKIKDNNADFYVEKKPYDIGEVKTISEPTNRPNIKKNDNQVCYGNKNCINFNITNNPSYLY